jgi:hypothetical protein
LPFNARRNSRAALVGAIAHIAAKGSRVSSNLGLNSPKNSAPAVKQEIEKNTEPASTTVDQKLSQEKLHNLNLLDKILLAFYVKVSSLLKTMKSVGSLQFNNL